MYKLYTDKQETFECDLFLEGADLKESSARLIVESKDLTLMFKGTIDEKGNCKVPIKKLKGLMNENTTGDIKLEVIAEDTLIEPWQSDFVVETAKKVTVEVKSQTTKPQIKESTKPQVKIKNIKNDSNPINEIVEFFKENNVTIQKVLKDKKRIVSILENYSNKIEYKGGTKKFIREVIKKLPKV
jgi:TRAP-type C4-dicarboxylate transport system substrate-binding protein